MRCLLHGRDIFTIFAMLTARAADANGACEIGGVTTKQTESCKTLLLPTTAIVPARAKDKLSKDTLKVSPVLLAR